MKAPNHLIPLPAADLHEFTQAYIFMAATELEAEREAIARLVSAEAGEPPSLEEGLAIAHRFARLAPFVERPSADELRSALAPFPPSQIPALLARLEQIRQAIWQGQRLRGRDYDSTEVFAVSPIWHHRWETVLGGVLHPAFVGLLLASQF